MNKIDKLESGEIDQLSALGEKVNEIIGNLNELIPNKDLSVLGAKILDKYRKDKKITLLGVHDELHEIDVTKLVDQFTDGLLYDLGHKYAYIVTRDAEDPARLVQDLAVYCVISYLMSQVKSEKKSDALRVCVFSAAKDLASNQASIARAKIAAEKLNDHFRTDEDIAEQVYHSAVEFCDEYNNISVWLTCYYGPQQLAKDIMDWRCYYKYDFEVMKQTSVITDRLPEKNPKCITESVEVVIATEIGWYPAIWNFETASWETPSSDIKNSQVYGWIYPFNTKKCAPQWHKL